MSIQQAVTKWDGKTVDDIEDVYRQYAQTATFNSMLIELSKQSDTQKAATWLLKHHLENQGHLSPAEVDEVYQVLPVLDHWEAKLHLLQSIPFLGIPDSAISLVESFLHECISSKNKFVRAWTYNGWYELAKQHPPYRAAAKQRLATGMEKESAASVRARIRNIIAQSDLGSL